MSDDPFPEMTDPDDLVEQMRTIVSRARRTRWVTPMDTARLCNLFDQVDVWVSAGGYFAAQWTPDDQVRNVATTPEGRLGETVLAQMRSLVQRRAVEEFSNDDAETLLHTFEELDAWLSSGPMPDSWSNVVTPESEPCGCCGAQNRIPYFAVRIDGVPRFICKPCWEQRQ